MFSKVNKNIEAIAFREAGYAVACYDLKLDIDDLSILAIENSSGKPVVEGNLLKKKFPEMEDTPSNRWQMEKMVVAYLCGFASEQKFNNWKDIELQQKVLDQIHIFMMPFVTWKEELIPYVDLLSVRAKKLVEDPIVWQEVQDLASRLLEDKEISSKKVRAIIRDSFVRSYDTWKKKHKEKR
jgi:hypothetical protein